MAVVSIPAEDWPCRHATAEERVAREVKTTFANQYTKEISLVQALQPSGISAYAKYATSERYLINPSKDVSAQA